MALQRCPRCGKVLEKSSNFCTSCGASIELQSFDIKIDYEVLQNTLNQFQFDYDRLISESGYISEDMVQKFESRYSFLYRALLESDLAWQMEEQNSQFDLAELNQFIKCFSNYKTKVEEHNYEFRDVFRFQLGKF